jgi:hypothetical protein
MPRPFDRSDLRIEMVTSSDGVVWDLGMELLDDDGGLLREQQIWTSFGWPGKLAFGLACVLPVPC